MGKVKQVILIRTDLNMRKGKMASQAAHASMAVILNMGKIRHTQEGRTHLVDNVDIVEGDYSSIEDEAVYELHIPSMNKDVYKWVTGAFTKICVGVDNEAQLRSLIDLAKEAGIPAAIMVDNGETEFSGQLTTTAAAIGPADSDLIDPITSHLKLL